ncbi:MAG: hypothetical protein AAFQ80_17870 [Cyanobacteria bacterium J06621_8]
MSALRQPDFPRKSLPLTLPKKTLHRQQIEQQTSVKSRKIVQSNAFSASDNFPKHLKTLSLVQKSSFALAIASMTTSIALYISTVEIPKIWSQEYHHLENLQKQERQLISINETIKYQIAQEAAQDKRLGISTPESAVFINPAKVEPRETASIPNNQAQLAQFKFYSWGY